MAFPSFPVRATARRPSPSPRVCTDGVRSLVRWRHNQIFSAWWVTNFALNVWWHLYIFLLMDYFLYRFSTLGEKVKRIYEKCKMHHRIPLFLALRLSMRRFQMPNEGLSFVKTLVKFRILYATDLLLQNMTKIVCLRWLTFDILTITPCKACCWITCANVSKSG